MDNIESSLFGSRRRTDPTPSRHAESTYAFLRRAAGPVWDQCRALIDEWLRSYPSEHRGALRARLRSDDDRVFTSGFWELYLHEMYRRDGWTINVEPAVKTRATRPDFLVSKADETYYVEARCTFESGTSDGSIARVQTIYDSLNKMNSGPFHLSVTTIAIGQHAPSTKRLRRDLELWLQGLDPDAGDYAVGEERPERQFEWTEDDWSLVFHPIPRAPAVRGVRAQRPLGVFQPAEASVIDDITPLRQALYQKGSKYGELGHPLVVAINIGSGFHDERDTEQALFGTVGWIFDFQYPDAEPRPVLTEQGYWGWATAPAHTHVAGVLLAVGMNYSRVARYAPIFWPHPDADRSITPLPSWQVALPTSDGLVYRVPSVTAPDLFDLPEAWPIGEPFPRHGLAH